MADTPDISKVVSVIMEHPELLSQITALLAKENGGGEESEHSTEPREPELHEASVPPVSSAKRRGRGDLLCAMKPYLSENRRKAVDTIITIADILDNMRNG